MSKPETWRWCRDCAANSGGTCAQHNTWIDLISGEVYPTSEIVSTTKIIPPQFIAYADLINGEFTPC